MGTWNKLFDIAQIDQRGDIGQISPLPDGRLIMTTNATSDIYVIYPDSTGEYTSYKLIDAPYVMQTGAPVMITGSGKAVILGGHHWEVPGQSTIKVFDPDNDTVYFISNRPDVGHSAGRASFHYLDDGRIVAPYATRDGTFIPPTTTQGLGLVTLNEDLTTSFQILGAYQSAPSGNVGESDYTLLPDGSLFGPRCNVYWRQFTAPPEQPVLSTIVVRPEYAQPYKDAGSWGGISVASETINSGFNLDPGVEDRSWMYRIGSSPTQYFTWGGFPLNITPEQPGTIYMPKINSVVIVGGTGGEIICWNASSLSSLPRIRATTPIDTWTVDDTRNSALPFVVSSSHAGQTAEQIVASGTLRLTCVQATAALGSFPYKTPLCIKTGNRWCVILASSVDTPPNASVSVGQTVTFTNLQLSYGSHDTPVSTQDRVFVNIANPRAIESWICVLPSGNLLYPAGYVGFYYTTSLSLYTWDGVSVQSVKDSSAFPFANAISFSVHGCIAPNGKLVMSDGSSVWQYTESSPPDTSYAPTVDLVPTALETGTTYTLFGRQLSGRHIGFMHGDDWGGHSNLGLVKLVNAQGNVYWGKTKNWSYRGIGPNRASSMDFTIPNTVPPGDYKLYAVSCGQSSTNYTLVNVTSKASTYGGDAILLNRYKKV